MKLVVFRHPLRSQKTWYLGYEEGNAIIRIGILRIEPEAFVKILNECHMSGEVIVDRSKW